jgi:ADP-ribosyltransferase of polymorphic toxin system
MRQGWLPSYGAGAGLPSVGGDQAGAAPLLVIGAVTPVAQEIEATVLVTAAVVGEFAQTPLGQEVIQDGEEMAAPVMARAAAFGETLGKPLTDLASKVEESAGEVLEEVSPRAASLFHYTTEEGMNAIVESGELNPSLKALNPSDARYGDGQYLSDIVPGSWSPQSMSSSFFGVPGQGTRLTNFVEVDVSGLDVVQGRMSTFVVPGQAPLDISNRIMSFGETW